MLKSKRPLPTGKEVDTYLKANPFIKKYLDDKFKKGIKAENSLHILTPEQFGKKLVEYLQKFKNPQTGSYYTEEEACDSEANIEAFQDIYTSNIYLHQERVVAGTVIHECLHLFQDLSYASTVGENVNEGSTEYFTKLICYEQKIPLQVSKAYQKSVRSIEKLVQASSEDLLAGAYFQGQIFALETAIDAEGKGIFLRWLRLMKQGQYRNANALL